MKVQKINNRSIMFTSIEDGWDLNIHLIVAENNNYLIDTGLGTGSIAPVLDHINIDIPIVVINTHYHWDHIWGNSIFADCTIISHSLCRQIIETKWDEMLEKNRRYVCGKAEKCLPNLVFEKELYFPEDGIRLIYTPGHTIDSISVLDEKDGVINLGDNIGDTIDEIVPNLNCDKQVYAKSLGKLKDYGFDKIVSGHNVVLEKDTIDNILALL